MCAMQHTTGSASLGESDARVGVCAELRCMGGAAVAERENPDKSFCTRKGAERQQKDPREQRTAFGDFAFDDPVSLLSMRENPFFVCLPGSGCCEAMSLVAMAARGAWAKSSDTMVTYFI